MGEVWDAVASDPGLWRPMVLSAAAIGALWVAAVVMGRSRPRLETHYHRTNEARRWVVAAVLGVPAAIWCYQWGRSELEGTELLVDWEWLVVPGAAITLAFMVAVTAQLVADWDGRPADWTCDLAAFGLSLPFVAAAVAVPAHQLYALSERVDAVGSHTASWGPFVYGSVAWVALVFFGVWFTFEVGCRISAVLRRGTAPSGVVAASSMVGLSVGTVAGVTVGLLVAYVALLAVLVVVAIYAMFAAIMAIGGAMLVGAVVRK